MSAQRASYLRRALPRMREQARPRGIIVYPLNISDEAKRAFAARMDEAFRRFGNAAFRRD